MSGATWEERARAIMPGGVGLISKRPERFCPGWPMHFRKAQGCEVWDMDGRHFYDFSYPSVGACLLGYKDQAVTEAVHHAIDRGNYCALSPFQEVALAERLCALHPWAERVKMARTGGEAMAIAVRIARATTGRDWLFANGYHGWSDWYMAANIDQDATKHLLWPNVGAEGVPFALRWTMDIYNDMRRFEFADWDKYAAVIYDACHLSDDDGALARGACQLAHKYGALFIMDEISAGFRHNLGGWHLLYDIQPDIAVFAKAMGNGHPIAAVIGSRAAMEGAERTFISSTYWTEATGPAAALATITRMEGLHWPEPLVRVATGIKRAWTAGLSGLSLPINVGGSLPECCGLDMPAGLERAFTAKMLRAGFLATAGVVPMAAHDDYTIGLYAEACACAFAEMERER